MNGAAGFALRDVLFGTAAVGALAAIAIPALSQVRMDSSRQACLGNYKFISRATSSYVNDNAGQMWALSWKLGMQNPDRPGLYFASDTEAQAFQAISIIKRLNYLPSFQNVVPLNWIAPPLYSHLALLDYVNVPIPAKFMICPEDWTRQNYADGDFSHGYPTSGENGTNNSRWPYSSSYSASIYQWQPSRQVRALKPNGVMAWTPFVFQNSSNSSLWNIDGDLSVPNSQRPQKATDVRYPSNKVFMSDDYARHNGAPRYYAYQTAAQDFLFHDGSVRFYRTDQTNPGWNPASRTLRGNMTSRFSFTKRADEFGGLDQGAAQATFQAGWYRWTRGGFYGWDVPRMPSMVGKPPSSSVVEHEVDTSAATGTW